MATDSTNLSQWDFHNFHVQQDLQGSDFVSAESTLIAAGPYKLEQLGGQAEDLTQGQDVAYPIGVVENLGLSQGKQLQRLFEIGSSRSYFVGGRVVGNVSMGRILYSGPTIMRSLYAYYQDTTEPVTINPLISSDGLTMPNVKYSPGYGDFWMNLASDIFNQPMGLLIYFKDNKDVNVGQIFLEYAYVAGHQLSISSGSVLLMEGVSIQYDRLVPVQVQAN
jgi:hypothetical protein